MDFNAIINRVIALITKPKEEWDVIKNENMTISDMFVKYALILAAIPPVAGFLGYLINGVPMGRSIKYLIFMYIFSIVTPVILGFLIDVLAPSFGSKKDLVASMKIAVFSSFPVWVVGILFIIPSVEIRYLPLIVGGLYSFYLFYLGLQAIKEPPQDKLVIYLIVIILVSWVVQYLIQFQLIDRIVFPEIYQLRALFNPS